MDGYERLRRDILHDPDVTHLSDVEVKHLPLDVLKLIYRYQRFRSKPISVGTRASVVAELVRAGALTPTGILQEKT